MLKKIKDSKLQIQYVIFWVNVSFIIVIIAIFPNIMTVFSKILGVYSPANLVYAAILFILLVKNFLMTIEISDLENRLKELAQTVALKNMQDGDLNSKNESENES
jgi:hypothetical protein